MGEGAKARRKRAREEDPEPETELEELMDPDIDAEGALGAADGDEQLQPPLQKKQNAPQSLDAIYGAGACATVELKPEAEGVLRTTSRTQSGARLTFRVDAHTDVRDSARGGVLQTVV